MRARIVRHFGRWTAGKLSILQRREEGTWRGVREGAAAGPSRPHSPRKERLGRVLRKRIALAVWRRECECVFDVAARKGFLVQVLAHLWKSPSGHERSCSSLLCRRHCRENHMCWLVQGQLLQVPQGGTASRRGEGAWGRIGDFLEGIAIHVLGEAEGSSFLDKKIPHVPPCPPTAPPACTLRTTMCTTCNALRVGRVWSYRGMRSWRP